MYVNVQWLRDNSYVAAATVDSKIDSYILLGQRIIENFTGRIFEKRTSDYFWDATEKIFHINNPVIFPDTGECIL